MQLPGGGTMFSKPLVSCCNFARLQLEFVPLAPVELTCGTGVGVGVGVGTGTGPGVCECECAAAWI